MSLKNQPHMTYGEFTMRRTSILSEINDLTRKLNGILDPLFKTLGGAEVQMLEAQLANARERLSALGYLWKLKQTKGKSL